MWIAEAIYKNVCFSSRATILMSEIVIIHIISLNGVHQIKDLLVKNCIMNYGQYTRVTENFICCYGWISSGINAMDGYAGIDAVRPLPSHDPEIQHYI